MSTVVIAVAVGAISYELFSLWWLSALLVSLVFFVYKHFKGRAARRMWRVWREQFGEFGAEESRYEKCSSESGVGFVQGSTVLFSANVNAEGVVLFNQWAIENRYIYLPWSVINHIAVRDYHYQDINQLLAEVRLESRPYADLRIPWARRFAEFVPSSVGLAIE